MEGIEHCIHWAATITTNCRLMLYDFLTYPKHKVYYCATDSFVCDKPAPKEWLGTDLGRLKNEFFREGASSQFWEGVFAAPNLYVINIRRNEYKTAFSGIPSIFINPEKLLEQLRHAVQQ